MPQFDPAVWLPQLIWLAIAFAALYLLMSRVALPRISDVLEEREHKINDSLRKAENLREEAETAAASYERMMADARAKAQAAVRKVREKAAEEAAEHHAELSEKLAEEIAAGEARIAEERARAVAGVRDMAVEVAEAAAARLVGEAVDAKKVTAAVDTAIKGGG